MSMTPIVPLPPELREGYEPTPAALAGLAAEVLRSLNHATTWGLTCPADVYEVIGSLRFLADQLPQALHQLGRWLDVELDTGRLGVDGGGDPAATVLGVSMALTDGAHCADYLRHALSSAHGLAAKLHRP